MNHEAMPPLLVVLLLAASAPLSLNGEQRGVQLASAPSVLLPSLLHEEDVASATWLKIRAIKSIVSGSILLAVGTGLGVGGAYLLSRSVGATGSTRTVYTALGWTLAGFGAVLAVVGIPILIFGIVTVSRSDSELALTVTHDGLALAF